MNAEGELARIDAERRHALETILDSPAPKKLIVAGPGEPTPSLPRSTQAASLEASTVDLNYVSQPGLGALS